MSSGTERGGSYLGLLGLVSLLHDIQDISPHQKIGVLQVFCAWCSYHTPMYASFAMLHVKHRPYDVCIT